MILKYEKQKSLKEIENLRDDYLKSLIEPQELYLELFVRESDVFIIREKNEQIGYFISDAEGNLYEYHILNSRRTRMDEILKLLINEFRIVKIFCKSFDTNLLSCAVDFQKKCESIGYLFREYEKKELYLNTEGISTRFAKTDDYEFIKEINEEVFESDEEIKETISNRNMILFLIKSEVIGFGIFQRTIPGYDSFDIGMLIVEKFRRKVFGSFIIQYMTDHCTQNGWRATCGCAINNLASRKTLEKAGYTTRHRMLLFYL